MSNASNADLPVVDKIEIKRDEPLKPGDIVEMHFKFIGLNWVYFRAAELAILEWQLKRENPDWQCTRWDSTTYSDKLVLEFLIKEPPKDVPEYQASVITPLIIAATVVGGGLFMYLTLDKVYKIVKSPSGKVALAGAGSLGIAVLIITVLILLRHYRE